MLNTKRSLTVKVVAGYVIVSILAGLAVWYIYNQVLTYSEIAQTNTENTQQLILVSEISTNLNESENTSRRLIQTGNEEELQLYNSQIDSIKFKINELETSYTQLDFEDEADSIYQLLEQKTENLKELVALRDTDRNTNYYRKALGELRNIDQSFKDYNYENRFRNLKSYQKDVLVKWLEYSREDNAENITTQRLDSLVKSVKRVLTDLEFANRQFQNEVVQKENELLNNDMILNQQLQGLLSNLEKSERKNSLERAETFQNMLDKTSTIILIGSCIIILIILYFIINIIGDITRSQRYRVQLEEAKNFAESLLASREQFMAAITHDLRSPLTTVMGYTDLIQKTDLDEKQAYYLKQIKKSSEFILRLVNDLLDLSKLEAGKMLIEKLAFHPGKLIEDTVNNIIPAERTKNVSIKIVVAPEAKMQLVSDPFRIKQILANLISNAWKFTEEGSIVISANLVKPKKNREILELRVKDSGIGISKEKQDSIFEEFSQEDNSIEKKFGGTGLGLAITKRLAHLLEGDIRVESEPGMGSEFIIEIPVEKYQPSGKKLKKSSEKKIEKNYAASGLKALVVDDEPGQLSLTVELSRSMGFEIDTAANGKIALEKINGKEYDLILTDIQMPVLDGFELIKTIRGTDEIMHLPVIALSGRTDLEKQVYMDAGFDEKLLKPYKSATLKETIAEVLDLEHKEPISSNVQGESTELQTVLYDLSEIYEFAGKDDDAFKEILRAFIEGTKESMEQLKSAWESQNEDELGKTAHKMLPMLRQMQAHTITPDLLKLEERKTVDETKFVNLQENLEKLIKDIEAQIIV
ncbi:hybrid sensor histidine kinase/response regulator [Christiangramia sp. OXR-203]|uniref:hybrid sensor histidine kinase/response regulator n=1 Tax=Christiangramia sp. OXR-203 TaxID=3100176 RepID=UPI002AC9D93F|nr:ATP-binding protein [Christiangramia sp. OXR-203]WPY98963.1 ATP-binding protein [Christiangramia sp. OXR-203]